MINNINNIITIYEPTFANGALKLLSRLGYLYLKMGMAKITDIYKIKPRGNNKLRSILYLPNAIPNIIKLIMVWNINTDKGNSFQIGTKHTTIAVKGSDQIKHIFLPYTSYQG